MSEKYISVVLFLLGVATGAGGLTVTVRFMRKEINGLGRRLNRVGLALVHICPDDKREEVMRMILGEDKRS